MDRTISIEEKIKRAEEIYARRHMNSPNNTATFNLGNSEKKNIGLLKKSIIQMSICLFIYLGVYIVQNNNYIFSNDFISAVRELINTDTNFVEIYNNISGVISNIFNNKKNNENEQIEQQEQSQEKIDDINAKSKVEDIDKTNHKLRVLGKGNKERYTILPDIVIKLLELYCREKDIRYGYIFKGAKGKEVMNNKTIINYFSVIKDTYNLDDNISFHSLRHSFATYYLMNGGTLLTLQSMLGHTNLNTTTIYLHLSQNFNELEGINYV